MKLVQYQWSVTIVCIITALILTPCFFYYLFNLCFYPRNMSCQQWFKVMQTAAIISDELLIPCFLSVCIEFLVSEDWRLLPRIRRCSNRGAQWRDQISVEIVQAVWPWAQIGRALCNLLIPLIITYCHYGERRNPPQHSILSETRQPWNGSKPFVRSSFCDLV